MDFTYHKRLTPIVGVVLALACAETIVLHVVAMAWWGWRIASLIGVLDLSLIFMLAQLMRSFRAHPITFDNGVVTMRTGRKFRLEIPIDNIAQFRATWSAEDLKARHVLNMALAAWPTTMFDLKEPVHRRGKAITAIAHCVDDPAQFQRVIGERLRAGDGAAD